MNSVAYALRAFNRARTRGIINTLHYSLHVARNTIAAAYIDLRYGGAVSKDRLHINKDKSGCNVLMHSEWRILRAIFSIVEIKEDDVLVDVGCGDGRVLNYWLSQGLRNRMIGIEIEPDVARHTANRYRGYPNVSIVNSDAAEASDSIVNGTTFYLYNPFTGAPLTRFEQALRGRDVRIVVYNYTDLTPFKDWHIDYLRSTRDELQYRVAVITSAKSNT